MKLRITGSPREIGHVLSIIKATFHVDEVSPFVPKDGGVHDIGHVHIDVYAIPRPNFVRSVAGVLIDEIHDGDGKGDKRDA